MTIWSDLIQNALGELTTEAKKRLIQRLTALGKEFVVPQVADTVSRVFVKSLDGVVKAAVQGLEMEEDAARLSGAYLDAVQDQLAQFSVALEGYLPHALAVEVAKKSFGSDSAQANEARKKREGFLFECKSEVRDLFRSVMGEEVSD
jgi:hypothetical protein